jgi:pyruvate formate lyase activating enzyme
LSGFENYATFSSDPFDNPNPKDEALFRPVPTSMDQQSLCGTEAAADSSAAKSATAGPDIILSARLDEHTSPGTLCYQDGDRIRCVACGHRCVIAPGRRGVCKVRYNDNGVLRVPFGYVAGVQCDPVEKKPFFHLYPGSDALTFGMLGCDFHCGYCQNWVTSQSLRDAAATSDFQVVTPQQLVRAGLCQGARLVVSSYNEPLITAEWAVAVFEEARRESLACAFVSNGNATAEALDFLKPHLTGYKIDLKSFQDRRYRSLGGKLEKVIEGIRMVNERGLWLEVVTLIVPGFNDDEAELRDMARFLVSVNPRIPWHVTAFHPDYKMMDPPATRVQQLLRAAEIGREEGLHFVYAGNAPGRVGRWEHTWCPKCDEKLIDRLGYLVRNYRITPEGKCPACGTSIPGVWPSQDNLPEAQDEVDYLSRRPRAIRL